MQQQPDQTVNIVLAGSAVFATVFSAFATWFAFRAAKAAEASARHQARSLDISILNQSIFEAYTDRVFKSASAPIIDGKQETSLRVAKVWAFRQFKEDRALWDRESHVDKYQEASPQNAIAYETAITLETFGVAVYAGLIPLRLLLPEVGDVIIDDFLLCLSWIRSYQEKQRAYATTRVTHEVPYHRRHAEWLAAVAGLWMNEHWANFGSTPLLVEAYGSIGNRRERVIALSQADGQLMPELVRKDLKELINVDL